MKSNIIRRGFLSLVVTQFLGAANDNLLKSALVFAVALSGIWENQLGDGGQAYVSLCLTLPFILFSGIAGQIADRYSKRRITIWVKIAEVIIAIVGMIAFLAGNLWIALATMLLLATQSAFFGPAKYGMIPELVRDDELSRANGSINMFTNIAVIFGTLLAGPIYQAYYPASDPLVQTGERIADAMVWAPGAVLIIIAVLGVAASLFLPPLDAKNPTLKFNFNPFGAYIHSTREMARSQLLLVAIAWSLFYLIAFMALLILPDYKALLNIDPQKASYLLGILGVAIGLGSVAAGLLSGHHIEPRLIPVGVVGMTAGFFLLGLLPLNYTLVSILLLVSGFFAGFYIIPLQSLLQYLSPAGERGRFLGTANAMSFVAGSIGTILFLFFRKTFGLEANRIFIVCGVLSLAGAGTLLWPMRKLILDPALRKMQPIDG